MYNYIEYYRPYFPDYSTNIFESPKSIPKSKIWESIKSSFHRPLDTNQYFSLLTNILI